MSEHALAAAVAAEVRAELGRQRKTQSDLATTLGMNTATAARRLRGEIPFDVAELIAIAAWLDLPPATFLNGTTQQAAAS